MNITLITGNQNKADQLAKWLGKPVNHVKVDLDELQSLDLKAIVKHKAQQAYQKLKKPVLVEDVELCCTALQGLPGPFVKWFLLNNVGLLCQIMNSFTDRTATARVMYALYDGNEVRYFEGSVSGSIASQPRGDGGFGWDAIFVPQGYSQTRAEQNEQDYEASSPRAKAIAGLRNFLNSH